MAAQTDIDQAAILADIISSSVHKIAQLSASSSSSTSNNALGALGLDNIGERDVHSADVVDAARCIVSASAQLSALVRSPEEVIMDFATAVSEKRLQRTMPFVVDICYSRPQYHVSAALRLITEASVPEAVSKLTRLRIHAPHVREIAAICGVDAEKLGEPGVFIVRRIIDSRGKLSDHLQPIFFIDKSSCTSSPRNVRNFH